MLVPTSGDMFMVEVLVPKVDSWILPYEKAPKLTVGSVALMSEPRVGLSVMLDASLAREELLILAAWVDAMSDPSDIKVSADVDVEIVAKFVELK